MTDSHAEFLQDPEAHASHLGECAECRALVQRLNAEVSSAGIDLEALPLAQWEGAAYRSWIFVAFVSGIVAAVAITLCHIAGITPLHAVASDASIVQWRTLLAILTGTLQRATLGWQIVFGMAFVAVNTLLFFLLRRPTRGIDA